MKIAEECLPNKFITNKFGKTNLFFQHSDYSRRERPVLDRRPIFLTLGPAVRTGRQDMLLSLEVVLRMV